MFVVTFYSYKGGVGRTSALINVAAHLASRGERVLIVDFDLEAPGISSFARFAGASQNAGVVDFICDYLDTAVAPVVDDYIVECTVSSGGAPIWVMPSGKADAKYSERLGRIDWPSLYNEKSGFLLFEDLKQQWRESDRGFTYVLIDSRTGHTDVGGICTRQLADIDVMMFMPNSQNISGMSHVVNEMRLDFSRRQRDVLLLFAPSNVPDLDDEHGILHSNLVEARERLSYHSEASVIHHYDSMALLDDAIFTVDRPSSKLSTEYVRLHNAIVSANVEDKFGSLTYLENFRKTFSDPALGGLRVKAFAELENQLARIGQAHIGDPEVALGLAAAYRILGQSSAEREALNVVLEVQPHNVEARLRRARLMMAVEGGQNVHRELLLILNEPDVPALELSSTVEMLKGVSSDWIEEIKLSPAVANLDVEEIPIFCRGLMVDKEGSAFAAQLLSGGNMENPLSRDFGLALIGSGQFSDALQYYANLNVSDSTKDVAAVFNLAIAKWGVEGVPDRVLFQKVLELDDGGVGALDANYLQCLALCAAVKGDMGAAIEKLDNAQSSVISAKTFSCWSYLYRERSQMLEDIIAMKQNFSHNIVRPEFLTSH